MTSITQHFFVPWKTRACAGTSAQAHEGYVSGGVRAHTAGGAPPAGPPSLSSPSETSIAAAASSPSPASAGPATAGRGGAGSESPATAAPAPAASSSSAATAAPWPASAGRGSESAPPPAEPLAAREQSQYNAYLQNQKFKSRRFGAVGNGAAGTRKRQEVLLSKGKRHSPVASHQRPHKYARKSRHAHKSNAGWRWP